MSYTYKYKCAICGKRNVVELRNRGVKLPIYCQPDPDAPPGTLSACQAEANRRRVAEYRKRKKAEAK